MMLPVPGTSLAPLKARIKAQLDDPKLLRVCVAFWLFGLINNIFYVIILAAALDLVGPSIPKATVLLCSIIPGLATKAIVPYSIHLVPYPLRILLFATLSTCGMLAVALSPATSIASKLAGIVLANVSSGAGEVNFLGLTHHYGPSSLAAWGSGTGGAGLLGAGAYALLTTTFGLGVRATLVSSALLPAIMLMSFFLVLPRGLLLSPKLTRPHQPSYGGEGLDAADADDDDDADASHNSDETAGLLTQPLSSDPSYRYKPLASLQLNLRRTFPLIIPYMLPLFLVYLAEYTINSGVAPTLLFPLSQTPFKHYRAFYPTYAALYQAGVFASRSSLPFLRIRTLYLPAGLQVVNFALLTAHALRPFLPSVWWVFGIVLWEGVLGGLVYVSAFAAVREEVDPRHREFSLGAVTVGDSAGIFLAGILGVVLENGLCEWQIKVGRDWCRRL